MFLGDTYLPIIYPPELQTSPGFPAPVRRVSYTESVGLMPFVPIQVVRSAQRRPNRGFHQETQGFHGMENQPTKGF